jgi:hypothetical protein
MESVTMFYICIDFAWTPGLIAEVMKSDLTLIAQSNAMRKSSIDNCAELPKLQQLIADKQLELQNS